MILLTMTIAFIAFGLAIYYLKDIQDSKKYFSHQPEFARNKTRLKNSLIIGSLSLLISILLPIHYAMKNNETLKAYHASMNYKTHVFTPQEMDERQNDKLTFYNALGQADNVYPFRDYVNKDRQNGTPIYVEGIVKSVEKDQRSFDYFLTFQNSSTIYRLNVTEFARYKLNREPYKLLLKVDEFADGGVYAHPINTDLFTLANDSEDIGITKDEGDE